jgi:hypothetical protein
MRAPFWPVLAVVAAGWSAPALSQPTRTSDSLSASASREAARRVIRMARQNPEFLPLPPTDSFTVGGRVVSKGSRVAGSVAVVNGPLEVYGSIDGDALALNGDVVVHRGGVVSGDARAVMGQVRLDGGEVSGEMRSFQGRALERPATDRVITPSTVAWLNVRIALGWFAMLGVIGIGVLVFAGTYLEGVVTILEQSFARSFWVGVASEVAIAPVLLLLVLALTLTILGVLLVPFAIVAYAIAAAGMLTLGFLAMAQVTGRSLSGARATRSLSERGAALRGLMVGLLFYLALWVAAAAMTWQPLMGAVLRGIAMTVTFAALTAGFGATVLSRAGARAATVKAAAPSSPVEEMSWQTPTPVSGVAAARRPTPAPYVTKER